MKRNIPKVKVPEGESGDWKIERFTVTKEDAKLHNLRCMINHRRGHRTISADTYTKLTRNGSVVMSDTPAEMIDHWWPVEYAEGHLLINGLGLGMVLNACLLKPEVKHATVVEISPDVVRLAATHYLETFGDKRLTIIEADAYTWKPPRGQRYDLVWHDIWSDVCGDNYEGMKKLRRKYGRRTFKQGCWCDEWTKELAKGA